MREKELQNLISQAHDMGGRKEKIADNSRKRLKASCSGGWLSFLSTGDYRYENGRAGVSSWRDLICSSLKPLMAATKSC